MSARSLRSTGAWPLAALVALLIGVVAACGDDGGGTTAGTTTTASTTTSTSITTTTAPATTEGPTTTPDVPQADQPYAEALGKVIGKTTYALPSAARTCAGAAVVANLGGATAFAQNGIQPTDIGDTFTLAAVLGDDSFSSANLSRLIDGLAACGAAKPIAAAGIGLVSTEHLDEHPDRSRTLQQCVAGKLTDDQAAQVLRRQLGGEDTQSAAQSDPDLIAALKACGGKTVVVP